MSQTDPIADYITRIRNSCRAKHKRVLMPATRVRRDISQVLLENNFIRGYTEIPDKPQSKLLVQLAYTPDQESHITNIQRVSRPGLRKYNGREELRLELREMGIRIVSTSRGIMSDQDAVAQGIGGEVLCHVW